MVNAPLPKVPRTPPVTLTKTAGDIQETAPLLWRIHRTAGAPVLPWNELRHNGPLPTLRFDPHPPPLGRHTEGVLYAATDLATALAEVFQDTRIIDTSGNRPQVTAWTPTRPLRLLNLTDTWALRNGAASSLTTAPRRTCRSWAQAIHRAWPGLDGLWTASTMTGRPSIVLWNPAATTFPTVPQFSRPLADPLLCAIVERIAVEDLHYQIL
jgi:hypothetical protein